MENTLKQILDELKGLRSDVGELKDGQKGLRADVEELRDGQRGLRADVEEVKNGQKEIKEAVIRLEETQPKDIIAILERIDKKLDTKDFELYALNKRVFKVETEIERLSR
jgi:chromosome segregation ATPase